MTVGQHEDPYRWLILALSTLSNAVLVAAPSMALAVLFNEIQRDLQLTLVEVGLIWSIGSLPGIFLSLLGGALGDRFGAKRMYLVIAVLAGSLGIARGFAQNFAQLIVLNSLIGGVSMLGTINSYKACGTWFPRRQLGLANSLLAMGMAGGFLIGSLISATWLSPWLGGWRNVLILYGVLGGLFAVPWLLTRAAPSFAGPPGTASAQARAASTSLPTAVPMRESLAAVVRLRAVWMLGLVLLGLSGCVQGLLGYLPLYLRGIGWDPAAADGALALFHTVSLVFALPIALISDRLGTRNRVLWVALASMAAGVGAVAFVTGVGVWVAIVAAGMVRDGFMSIYMTAVVEVDGVGARYVGTATGFAMVLGSLGSLFGPPIGNSLAAISPNAPFLFWAFLAVAAMAALAFVPEARRPLSAPAVAEPI